MGTVYTWNREGGLVSFAAISLKGSAAEAISRTSLPPAQEELYQIWISKADRCKPSEDICGTPCSDPASVPAPAAGKTAATCAAEVAEARWRREDGSWSKKYYACRIMERRFDEDGCEEFMVEFVQDKSKAEVPRERIRWPNGNSEHGKKRKR